MNMIAGMFNSMDLTMLTWLGKRYRGNNEGGGSASGVKCVTINVVSNIWKIG